MKNIFTYVQKSNKGITLIALVVTIIVLLILAGISISMLSGDNSILSKAGEAKDLSGERQIDERVALAVNGATINGLGTLNYTNLDDELKKDFGEGNYTINPQNNAESWTVTATENVITRTYTIYESGKMEVADNPGGEDQTELTISLTIQGESIDTIPIPEGFYYVGGTKDTGFIISDSQADENKGISHEVAQTLAGNQFVWVPVDKNQKISLKVNSKDIITGIKLYDPKGTEISVGSVSGNSYDNTNITPTINGKYKVEVTTENDTKTQSLVVRSLYAMDGANDFWSSEEGINVMKTRMNITDTSALFESLGSYIGKSITNEDEFGMVYAGMMSNQYSDSEDYTTSVNNNGGFYIARYEAGIATQRTSGNSSTDGSTMDAPLSKANVYVYNYVTGSQAKEIAEKMYIGKSHLLTGAAWDRTLDWLINTKNKTINQINVDSKDWGNYPDSSFEGHGTLAKTGAFGNNTKANNIFDLAGNVWEWTSASNPDGAYINRGGNYTNSLRTNGPAISQGDIGESLYMYNLGFRVALFL